jgi:hypothetical protein
MPLREEGSGLASSGPDRRPVAGEGPRSGLAILAAWHGRFMNRPLITAPCDC